MDLRGALDMVSSHLGVISTTNDHREAVAAFNEKRPADIRQLAARLQLGGAAVEFLGDLKELRRDRRPVGGGEVAKQLRLLTKEFRFFFPVGHSPSRGCFPILQKRGLACRSVRD